MPLPLISSTMEDRFGHRISYLRVSITDRCNERCNYCMPRELQEWLPRTDILSFEETLRIIRIGAELGVTIDAVWLAWGSPEQKGFGRWHGKSTETWIYRAYYNEYDPYYGGFGYGYGYGYPGFIGGGVIVGRHGHRRFLAVYDPFYDPFFYPRFRQVSYPYKTVTFSNGRVVAYQSYTPPRGY